MHDCAEPLKLKFSEHLSRMLKYDYAYLSHLFATHAGMTLEHYLITERIRKVKELVEQGQTLTEIAYQMCYCSVQHLPTQFKKVTGITPSEFRKRMGAQQ
ncbi:MAG: AraC family transcriptional regulator [Sphingobacteriales bacterium]|nr:MAG: AraC family transcriptional regulator [Sphingobacteriales bacterium]